MAQKTIAKLQGVSAMPQACLRLKDIKGDVAVVLPVDLHLEPEKPQLECWVILWWIAVREDGMAAGEHGGPLHRHLDALGHLLQLQQLQVCIFEMHAAFMNH